MEICLSILNILHWYIAFIFCVVPLFDKKKNFNKQDKTSFYFPSYLAQLMPLIKLSYLTSWIVHICYAFFVKLNFCKCLLPTLNCCNFLWMPQKYYHNIHFFLSLEHRKFLIRISFITMLIYLPFEAGRKGVKSCLINIE